jgi:hyperosmotically inducible periplasmic protein
MIRLKRILCSTCVTAALSVTLVAAPLPQTKEADNTSANKQSGKTADDQKETAQDRKLSQQIRKSLSKDKSLSTYAHNVKVISANGTVTLRGPVRSEDEKAAIEAKAKEVAGVSSVMNELTVAPK